MIKFVIKCNGYYVNEHINGETGEIGYFWAPGFNDSVRLFNDGRAAFIFNKINFSKFELPFGKLKEKIKFEDVEIAEKEFINL